MNKTTRLWPRVAAVSMAWKIAAAVTAVTLGVWLYHISNIPRHPDLTLSSRVSRDLKDVAPGKNTATLTLANGKTINLSDAKTGVVIGNDLRYNDGTEVAPFSPSRREGVAREGNNNNPLSPQEESLSGGERSRVQTLTASTPRGGTYQVTLPDGTKVWLNADSKISFPSQFSGKERKILLLNGEAYFEVSKLTRPSLPGGANARAGIRFERVPFIVQTPNQRVDVLGTHFNISDYKDEPIVKTTLLEGSIRLEGKLTLKPGQQSQITRNGLITVLPANLEEAIAWKNGYFSFNDLDIQTIMQIISRWYDIDLSYEGNITKDGFNGKISRFKNISQVLKMLEDTKLVHFKVEGRRVIVRE